MIGIKFLTSALLAQCVCATMEWRGWLPQNTVCLLHPWRCAFLQWGDATAYVRDYFWRLHCSYVTFLSGFCMIVMYVSLSLAQLLLWRIVASESKMMHVPACGDVSASTLRMRYIWARNRREVWICSSFRVCNIMYVRRRRFHSTAYNIGPCPSFDIYYCMPAVLKTSISFHNIGSYSPFCICDFLSGVWTTLISFHNLTSCPSFGICHFMSAVLEKRFHYYAVSASLLWPWRASALYALCFLQPLLVLCAVSLGIPLTFPWSLDSYLFSAIYFLVCCTKVWLFCRLHERLICALPHLCILFAAW